MLVQPIPQLLHNRRHPAIKGFRHFFYDPHRLAGPLARGDGDGTQRFPLEFLIRRHRRADVVGRVAMGDGLGGQLGGGGGDVVTQTLEVRGKAAVVQAEAGVVLHRPQRLAEAVEVRVENAKGSGVQG